MNGGAPHRIWGCAGAGSERVVQGCHIVSGGVLGQRKEVRVSRVNRVKAVSMIMISIVSNLVNREQCCHREQCCVNAVSLTQQTLGLGLGLALALRSQ